MHVIDVLLNEQLDPAKLARVKAALQVLNTNSDSINSSKIERIANDFKEELDSTFNVDEDKLGELLSQIQSNSEWEAVKKEFAVITSGENLEAELNDQFDDEEKMKYLIPAQTRFRKDKQIKNAESINRNQKLLQFPDPTNYNEAIEILKYASTLDGLEVLLSHNELVALYQYAGVKNPSTNARESGLQKGPGYEKIRKALDYASSPVGQATGLYGDSVDIDALKKFVNIEKEIFEPLDKAIDTLDVIKISRLYYATLDNAINKVVAGLNIDKTTGTQIKIKTQVKRFINTYLTKKYISPVDQPKALITSKYGIKNFFSMIVDNRKRQQAGERAQDAK